MKDKKNLNRTMTISTKVTALEKVELIRISDKYGISPAELYYSLIQNFKNHYEFIGFNSPKEEKLSNELEFEKKKNRKLSIELENAVSRIEIEQKLKQSAEKETENYRNKTIQLSDEKTKKDIEIEGLKEKEIELILKTENIFKNDKKKDIGSLILFGASLLLLPIMLKK